MGEINMKEPDTVFMNFYSLAYAHCGNSKIKMNAKIV